MNPGLIVLAVKAQIARDLIKVIAVADTEMSKEAWAIHARIEEMMGKLWDGSTFG